MNSPRTLHKKEEKNMETWILQHSHIFLPICIIILLILMVALAYAIMGVSATDSGVYYNHFQDVI